MEFQTSAWRHWVLWDYSWLTCFAYFFHYLSFYSTATPSSAATPLCSGGKFFGQDFSLDNLSDSSLIPSSHYKRKLPDRGVLALSVRGVLSVRLDYFIDGLSCIGSRYMNPGWTVFLAPSSKQYKGYRYLSLISIATLIDFYRVLKGKFDFFNLQNALSQT